MADDGSAFFDCVVVPFRESDDGGPARGAVVHIGSGGTEVREAASGSVCVAAQRACGRPQTRAQRTFEDIQLRNVVETTRMPGSEFPSAS